ncbi:hypothetical protein PGTUg99_014485 [Puccinia graminis f. sp. tritici]|uniref:Uncharacterized protein n=1 Tax=Puccinia graminis f. sp. tritici TaxID=56615 RepID=A0A5B0S0G4_PUCGR|nr:hypothetical protein PGTUg99_014485 [Puccinia graminis f. sp. tritici]
MNEITPRVHSGKSQSALGWQWPRAVPAGCLAPVGCPYPNRLTPRQHLDDPSQHSPNGHILSLPMAEGPTWHARRLTCRCQVLDPSEDHMRAQGTMVNPPTSFSSVRASLRSSRQTHISNQTTSSPKKTTRGTDLPHLKSKSTAHGLRVSIRIDRPHPQSKWR